MTFRGSMAAVGPPPRRIIHLATAPGVETIVAETSTLYAECDRYDGSTGELIERIPERWVVVDPEGKTHTIYPHHQPVAWSETLTPEGWAPDSLTFDRYGWHRVEPSEPLARDQRER
jgi:hypothetical protein